MFSKIKKKSILENSNKLLDQLWENNDIDKDRLEIYRQHINHTIMILSLDKLYVSPIIIKDNFIILDIGCGIMTWENELISISKNNKLYDKIYIFCIDKYNFFNSINNDDFDSIKAISEEVNIIFDKYDVTDKGLMHEDETINFVFQRDMISVYKVHQWNAIINEMYRVLKKDCYAEIIEYDINIKNETIINNEISNIFNETLINIFKINGQEINILNIYNKIISKFGEKNVKIIKKKLPLYYEDNFKGFMVKNMLLGYNYFKNPLTKTLKLKDYNFDEALELLKDEWYINRSYMVIYIITAKKDKSYI